MDFRFDIVVEYLPFFLKGAFWTIILSLIGIAIGTLFGLIIGMGKMVKQPIVRYLCIWYINFFRGTPLLVQIFITHFAIMPLIVENVNPFVSGAVALSLNASAYIAEILRAGIQSIDPGQMEAARSLGMSHSQAMRKVILPQAFKRMIPPLGNEFIVLVKDSSLISLLGVTELMYWGRAAVGQYYRVWEPYITVALIYLALNLFLTYLLNRIERRFATK